MEVLPLTTNTRNSSSSRDGANNNDRQRILFHDASSLRGSSAVLCNDSFNDGGDVLAFIQQDNNSTKRKLVVQRMDGTDVASFALPVDNDNSNNAASSRQQRNSSEKKEPSDESESYWSDGYSTQVLCWASFHRQQRDGDDDDNDGINTAGRKMLCVLGNQTTLFVFDVLGDTAILATAGNHSHNPTNDDDDDAGGGPAGHTIALPFRAKSIYPVPNGCGLIVVRTPAEEDYMAVEQELEEMEDAQSLAFGGGVATGEGGRVDESIPLPPPPALGMSLPATPRRQPYEQGKTNEDDDELSLEIGPPDPLRFGVSSNNNHNFNHGEAPVGLLPCLFTLRHPLDEIRPVAMTTTVASSNIDEEDGVGVNTINNSMTDSPLRDGITNNMIENHTEQEKEEEEEQQSPKLDLFTDVNETLVYVGSPRLFFPHPTSSYDSSGSSKSSSSSSPPMICVTYNETLNRHTIWSLSKSKSDVEDVPLWKSTGRGAWREREMTTEKEEGEEVVEMAVEEEEELEEEEDVIQTANNNGVAVTSSFSDIHPDFTLTRVFVEDGGRRDDLMDGEEELDDDLVVTTTKHAEEKVVSSSLPRYERNVFLATDTVGNGDLILCIFMPNDTKQQLGNTDVEPALLRCYSLNLSPSRDDKKQKNDAPILIDSVSHVVDVACSSAQPVQSIPIPLKSFSRQCDKGHRSSSRFQSKDVTTLARDILVIQKNNDKGGEHQSKLRLFRAGSIHIVDFALPKSMMQSDTFQGFHCVGLKNAVGNRIDIKLVKVNETSQTKIVRSEITLIVHASPVSETALRAIESSLGTDGDEESSTLPLLIRADCMRLLQQMWSSDGDNNMPSGVEDIAWYTLTVVLLKLLLLGRNGDGSRQPAMQSSEEESGELSVWEQLLQSDFHAAFSEGEGRLLFGDSDPNDVGPIHHLDASSMMERYNDEISSLEFAHKMSKGGDVLNFKKHIFDSLHLLHEDSRLVSKSRGNSWTRRLGSLLLQVSEQMSPLMMDFEDHYQRYLGSTRCFSTACITPEILSEDKFRLSSFDVAPCIMTWVDSILQIGSIPVEEMEFGTAEYLKLVESGLNGVCATSWMIIRLLSTIMSKSTLPQNLRDRQMVMSMLDEGVYHPIQLQEELPMSISLILLETIRRCRADPPQIDSSEFYWSCAAYDLVGRNDLAELLAQTLSADKRGAKSSYSYEGSESQGGEAATEDPDKDGLAVLEDFSSMIFPDDNRIKEATRLLRSSRPLFLRVPRAVELTDHEYERSKQDKLLLLCRRSIATPLGRGMLTLGTHRMLSSDQLLIPDIVLAGRVPPANGTLALDMSSCPPNFRIWPEFHNGVAAGLRLPDASGDGGKVITRTWIKFNKPTSPSTSSNNTNQNPPSYAHGGFLMALGLRGHLAALNTSDLTDYLSQGTITTTVGVFLGMAANKRGSCDPGVSKMLCLHVPSLLPPSFIPMDLASTVQAAAVAGIGLLYQKSSHRLMTEFLLNEIGRQPTKDQNTNDRESFALVCGLSLGLINLQKGKSTVNGLEDLKIEERLHRYISGVGADKFQNTPPPFPNGSQTEGDRNARIHESDMLNRDITAPGSILALGLMYIKSKNVSVASILKLPDTHFLLDYIRPDLLALRVLAKSLILWNVEPTAEWIDSQVPSVVQNSIEFMRKAAAKAISLGMGMGMDDEIDGNGDESKNDVADFDPQAVRQANAFIIAGACFSIGIRYAGSANREAAAAIFQRVMWFLELRDNKDATRQVQRPDLTTLTTCLCTSAISLAMVMAGTGDLDSFRLFRALRWSCDDNVTYGTHMIYGAAIGLLFLGGGKQTLGSSPEDVAMLIAAFFPHYPVLSSDNQYHLQALRHMYVLAAHDRILESVDVDSREKVCIPIELSLPDTPERIQSSTPFLVANNSNFVELRTKSDRYYPIVLKTTDWNSRGFMSNIFVKRKPGHLSYLQDPNALRSLSIQAGSTNSESFLNSIKMMSDDSVLASFVKYFCKAEKKGSYPGLLPEANSGFLRYCNLIANECMQEEKSEMLPLYLTLYRLMNSRSGEQTVSNVWDLRILRTYMRRKGLPSDKLLASVNLVSQELITLVCEHMDGLLESAADLGEYKADESELMLPTEKVWYEVPLQSIF